MGKLAEQLIRSLHSLGVRYVFGIPGGPSIPYMDAMKVHGIQFVLVSNEQSAAIMADVVGRLTGIPGVCHGTFGPGATNLSTGVGEALLDRTPLIAFTTEMKDSDRYRTVQMNIDHQALYTPLTKWTTRLTGEDFKETLEKAFSIAVSEVPGPVHIGLPTDITDVEIDDETLVDSFEVIPVGTPDTLLLEQAGRMIREAKKPLIVVGLTALRSDVYQQVRALLDASSIPVVLTPMAKGIVPETHPCYGGVLFHACSDIVANIYNQADLVIGIGYDPIEFNYEAWMPQAPLIHIDISPADITPEFDVSCDITGDLAVSLDYLNTLDYPVYDWDLPRISENRKLLFQTLAAGTGTFTPSQAVTVLREVLPEDGIVTADVGAHLHLLGQIWQVDEPNRFIITDGWSAMGFGIPAAIAAKLCRPGQPVVCVTGDGGFLMNCGELVTARRLGLNVVVVVMCDRNLSLIEVKQGWKEVAQYGTALYEGDYFGAERFLDVPILKAVDERSMKLAMTEALSMNGPVVIEAVVDGSEYKRLIARRYR